MDQKHLTHSESLSFNIEAICLQLSSPSNFLYEIKMDKYRPCPSIFAMFTSDSQHPPRCRHAVYLGDAEEDEIAVPLCLMIIALATQHLNGPRIIRSLDSTNKCI